MAYVRLTLMQPKAGHEAEVARILDDLVAFYKKQRGYIRGYKLRSLDSGELGRFTVWESGEAADHAASAQHVLALRSELLLLVEEESHVERAFEAAEPPGLLAQMLERIKS